jgi:hypothetical protein
MGIIRRIAQPVVRSVARAINAASATSAQPPAPPLSLAGLTDVELTAPQNGDELVFDATQAKWVNEQ